MIRRNCLIKPCFAVALALIMMFSCVNAALFVSAEEAESISVDLSTAVLSGKAMLSNGAVNIDGDAEISFSFDSDAYISAELMVSYRVNSDGNRSPELGLTVNNQVFSNDSLTLPRIFKDGEWKSESRRPQQVIVDETVTNPVRYYDQRNGERLTFDIQKGKNTVKLSFTDQQITINALKFEVPETLSDYTPIKNVSGNKKIVIEAEKAQYKSDSSLSPTYDLTSDKTSPYSYSEVYLNTIGDATWTSPGQWISWEFDVEEEGYYNISMRVRQNESRGLYSYRRISIDGKVLYNELDAYAFKYDRSWYIETLNNGNDDIYFKLSKGKHTLKMEAVMGDALNTFNTISDAVTELNSIYRNIIMITGTSPDTNRSYQLFKKMTTLSDDFKRLSKVLKDEIDRVEKNTGTSGTSINFLNQFSEQLKDFSEKQDLIITSFETFKSNISTLASQLTSLNSQPLEIDKIVLSENGENGLDEDMNFFERIRFELKRFIISFSQDYNELDVENGEASKELTVWCMMGRDQAQIINNMVTDTFTPENNVKVNVSVITAGLSEAVMAGKGPDVVMGIDSTTAINLGVRGALLNLKQYSKQYDGIVERFQKTAMNPYSYKNEAYAFPNTQEFNMMFIRTDIYEELGLTVCDTWDELLKQLAVFSQYHMTAGIPTSIVTTMLLQNGMNYYNDDLTKTVFGTEKAYNVYHDFTNLYIDYETPISYDGANRFRSGEMPVVIAPFSFYNTLSVLAPEVQGLWDMYLVPGTLVDGKINRSVEDTGTASAIINASKNKETAIEFLDWWTSYGIQSRFGLEIENILGRSGRYATANVEAFNTLNWSSAQIAKLQEQRKWISSIPGTPVSYIITRNMNNIFYMTVDSGNNLKEMMIKYSRQMDDEIKRKYAELETYK